MLGKVHSRLHVALVALSAALCLGGWSGVVQADGAYLAGRAGVNILSDIDVDVEGAPVIGEVESNPGAVVGGAVGYRLPRSLRVEGEISWRRNGLDKANVGRFAADVDDGHLSALSFMANAFYDFDNPFAVTPYVGGGIGLSRVALNDAAVTNPRSGAVVQAEDDEDVVFAYQVAGGLNIQLTEKTSLTAGYRFFRANNPEIEGAELEYQNHSLMAGLQYNL